MHGLEGEERGSQPGDFHKRPNLKVALRAGEREVCSLIPHETLLLSAYEDRGFLIALGERPFLPY